MRASTTRTAIATLTALSLGLGVLGALHGATTPNTRTIVRAADHPYLVDLQVWADQQWSHQCTASLVSDRVVVTADHCVAGDFDPGSTRLVFGTGSGTGSGTAVLGSDLAAVVQLAPGPDHHDVALLVLPTTRTERPIPLGADAPAPGTTVDMLTWRDDDGRVAERTALTVRPQQDCDARSGGETIEQTEAICAGAAGDVRHGDSGGPLVTSGADPVQLGVVSNGAAGRPTGFTDLTDAAIRRALVAATPGTIRGVVTAALDGADS